jgi:hypothetical protein
VERIVSIAQPRQDAVTINLFSAKTDNSLFEPFLQNFS